MNIILSISGSLIRYRGENDFDILGPNNSTIAAYSYLGYAVASAQFNKLTNDKTYYVASSPRAISGEIKIYDISNTFFHLKKSIVGTQIGEYFGYALLVEDFNNDGLPDLAVSAPMHSVNKEYDNGAVYIYLNQGNVSNF